MSSVVDLIYLASVIAAILWWKRHGFARLAAFMDLRADDRSGRIFWWCSGLLLILGLLRRADQFLAWIVR